MIFKNENLFHTINKKTKNNNRNLVSTYIFERNGMKELIGEHKERGNLLE